MKIAVITDTHFGNRNDSSHILDNQEKFYSELFFPTLKEYEIDTVLHLGDLFDRRKFINYTTLARTEEMFLKPLEKRGIQMHLIVGNHDVYYKTTNSINSPQSLLKHYSNIHIYTDPTELTLDGTKILLLPWITKDNAEQSSDMIRKSKAYIIGGHLEIQGFEMYRGTPAKSGLDRSIFDRFNLVMSGHFHHKSTGSNIEYLGAPSEYIWSDYDDPRGFHILDTSTEELEFIQNDRSIFKKVIYDDVNHDYTDLLSDEDAFSVYKGCYIKVVIVNKENPALLETIVKNIEKADAADVTIVESHFNLDISEEDDIVELTEDTATTLKKITDTIQNEKYRGPVNKLLHELYREAHNLNSEIY